MFGNATATTAPQVAADYTTRSHCRREQCVPTLVPQLSAAMLPVALALRQMCGGNF